MRGTRRERPRHRLFDAPPDRIGFDHDALEFQAIQRRSAALFETLRALPLS